MPLSPLVTGARTNSVRAWVFCACVCLFASALAAFGPTYSDASGGSGQSRRDAAAGGPAPGSVTRPSAEARARALDAYGRLPLRFEANRGQAGAGVKFLSRGSGYTLFLTGEGAVLRLRGGEGDEARVATLKLKLEGARARPRVEGVGRLPGLSNYFVGESRRDWRTAVPGYERVRYASVYPGVDLVYYGNQGRLEYDFNLAPGADPSRIRLNFEGATSLRLDERGELLVGTELGEVRQLRPFAYQQAGGVRTEVPAGYVVGEGGRVGFEVGPYDRSLPLVIDPVLVYSTYLGGGGAEQGLGVAVDAAGHAYVAGVTSSLDFPGPSPIQRNNLGFNDAFILKLSTAGDSLIYATYLGGTGDDTATSIAVDAAGSAYVAGWTGSGGFPRTPGAWQQAKDGSLDAFLTKLDPSGASLAYSTLLGGAGSDTALGVAVDAGGRAYVVGRTESPSFQMLPPELRAGDAVQKSTDGAATWAPSDAGLWSSTVNSLAFAPGNANTLYAATSNGVFRSTDAGVSWQLTGTVRPSTAPNFTFGVVVDPSNPSVVYAGASNGVFKSTDGGALYEQKSSGIISPPINALVINPASPATLYAGTIAGVFKSTNGGESWVEARTGLTNPAARVNRLAIDPSNPSVLYAGTNRGVYKTTNAGGNWVPVNEGLSGGALLPQIQAIAIDPVNPSTLYVSATGVLVGVFKSTDGGASWVASGNGIGLNVGGATFAPLVNALAVDPSAPSTIYAGAANAGVFKSTDGGANWAPADGGLTSRNVLALAVAPGSPATVYAGAAVGGDGFILRFNAAGSLPEYFRFLGGSENDEARGVAVDSAGRAYVIGTTGSSNFPVANALQALSGGFADAFLTKLDASGTGLLFSTYLGGSGTDQGRAVALDAEGNAFVTGSTSSENFPVLNALHPTHSGFGFDAFVAKLHASGSPLVYSTFLGGELNDQGSAIAVDAAGNAHVAGSTSSTDFPVANQAQPDFGGDIDAFVTKLNAAGSALVASGFLGGAGAEQVGGIALDGAGAVYVVGNTLSQNFPVANALKGNLTGPSDAFIAKIRADADLSITKADSRDPVMVNNHLTYTLTVSNAGPDEAASVVVTDTLPAGVSFVSASAGQGSCSGAATVTCQLGTLAADASVVVQIVVTPTAQGTLLNRATVASATPDRDASNNTVTQQTRVAALPSIAGRVTRAGGGPGLGGVTVTLGGSHSAATTTDDHGFYQFAELAAGGSYTVTPSRPGFVFRPQSRSVTNLTADATADFSSVECSFAVSPSVSSFPASGGGGVLEVTAPDVLCPRTAVSHAPWITVTSGAAAQGSGTVTFSVAPTDRPRVGRLTVAGRAVTVRQQFNPCAGISFTTAPRFPAGSSTPNFVRAGDFNHDGQPDAAVFNDGGFGSSQISILLGSGAGGFAAPRSFPVGGTPRWLTLGDFNHDGKLDVAATIHAQESNVAVLLGDGAGNLSPRVFFNAGGLPVGVAVGDFNRDGKADLVVANENSHNVSFLAGDGAGGFAAPSHTNHSLLHTARRIETADFDRDGNLDLIVRGSFPVMLRGNGNGTFQAPVQLDPSLGVIAVGDFNRDGKADLATTVFAPDGVAVALGDGAGGFSAPVRSATGSQRTSRLVLADFNQDGNPDLAALNAGEQGARDVHALLGDGAGGFTAARTYHTGRGALDIDVADFNADGRQDIIAADGNLFESAGAVVLLAGKGTGEFVGASSFVPLFAPNRVVAGDFNGDGRQDLISSNFNLHFSPGLGGGAFGAGATIAADVRETPLHAGDFNHDGKLDFVVVGFEPSTSKTRVRFFHGDGAGGFTPSAHTTLESPARILFGDFNGDGHLDLISTTGITKLAMHLGNGAGGFGAPSPIFAASGALGLAAGDFNGDGRLDFAETATTFNPSTGISQTHLYVFTGNGAGGFGAPAAVVPLSSVNPVTGVNLLAHDFNGDGRDDIAMPAGNSQEVLVWLAEAGGGLGAPSAFAAGNSPVALSLGDFNGDALADLVVTSGDSGAVPRPLSVLPGDGAGRFGAPLTLHVGTTPSSVAVADFDGDGRDDLSVANNASVITVLNACPVTRPDSTVRFGAQALNVGEGDGSVTVTVTREGSTAGPAAVAYSTVRGSASDRSDYTAATGLLSFAAGEASKSFTVFITDDAHAEGQESLTLLLTNAEGVALGAPNNLLLTIADNDAAPSPVNPVDSSAFFVRQHYRDFLGRDPDEPGLNFWTNEIEKCGADRQCREVKRVNVSAAFFLSIEFQETGYLAYRVHKAAFGDVIPPNISTSVPGIRLRDFLADAGRIGRGVQVGVGDWFNQLEANKEAYVLEFVRRPLFAAAFPETLTAEEFVDRLNERAGGVLSAEERAQLVASLAPTPSDTQKRAAVLRKVAEDADLRSRETRRAFVLMQYFGYLRRDADDVGFDGQPDPEFKGYRFWLGKLEEFNGNFVRAEMVKAFITSIEYRQRFGQ